MSADRLTILRGELARDVAVLSELEAKHRLLQEKLRRIEPDEFDHVALGYTLANLYAAMENYFLRVAKAFENHLEPAQWHRRLLERMTVELEGTRPALLTPTEMRQIDELRAFRHVFRHIYQGELDREKLLLVEARAPAALEAFRAAHRRFSRFLEEAIRSLGPGE